MGRYSIDQLEMDSRLTPRARELRKNATKQENHLWFDFLKQRPERWHRQKVIGCFIVDFFCWQAKLAVELDGMQHSSPQGLAYDLERSAYLETQGLTVLRFRNSEIDNNFCEVCTKIASETERRIHQ